MSSRLYKRFFNRIGDMGVSIGIAFLTPGIIVLIVSFIYAKINESPVDVGLLGTLFSVISVGLGFIAIGISTKADKYIKMMLTVIKGEITQEFSAHFDVARIVNKVKLTETAREYEVYNSSENIGMRDVPFTFGNAWICLDNMKEKDVVRIRVYIKEGGGEYQINMDEENTYEGIQVKPVRIDGGFYNQEGIEITAEHVFADSSPLEISCYAYDAARGS